MGSSVFGNMKRAAVGIVASAFGVILWSSGCSDPADRYYCDDTGCYNCDGYGCSTVSPPSTTSCTGASSCASGETCVGGNCEKTCEQTSDCPQRHRLQRRLVHRAWHRRGPADSMHDHERLRRLRRLRFEHLRSVRRNERPLPVHRKFGLLGRQRLLERRVHRAHQHLPILE